MFLLGRTAPGIQEGSTVMRSGPSFMHAGGVSPGRHHRRIKHCVTLAIVPWVLAVGGADAGDDGPWITFVRETATRINAAAAISTSDNQEKDYVWGDFDRDGDIDLICVRKIPFTHEGGRRNVLFLNQNGVGFSSLVSRDSYPRWN